MLMPSIWLPCHCRAQAAPGCSGAGRCHRQHGSRQRQRCRQRQRGIRASAWRARGQGSRGAAHGRDSGGAAGGQRRCGRRQRRRRCSQRRRRSTGAGANIAPCLLVHITLLAGSRWHRPTPQTRVPLACNQLAATWLLDYAGHASTCWLLLRQRALCNVPLHALTPCAPYTAASPFMTAYSCQPAAELAAGCCPAAHSTTCARSCCAVPDGRVVAASIAWRKQHCWMMPLPDSMSSNGIDEPGICAAAPRVMQAKGGGAAHTGGGGAGGGGGGGGDC